MNVVVTTIVRGADRGEDGFVYVIDWDEQTISHQFVPPPAMNPELGPRGGTRGYRGITFSGAHCLIANNDSVFAYNDRWEVEEVISHPMFCDLHEIRWDGEALWVVSTGIDAILKCSPSGELLDEYVLGELEGAVASELRLPPRPIDRSIDHRLRYWPPTPHHISHPNAVDIHEGRPYVTLYNQGAVIALNPLEVIWHDEAYRGMHSGRMLPGRRLCVARSYQRSVELIDLERRRPAARVEVLPESLAVGSRAKRAWQGVVSHPVVAGSAPVKLLLRNSLIRTAVREVPGLSPKAQSLVGWARGLAVLSERRVLAGTSPATVCQLNLETGSIERYVALDSRVENAVFEVGVDPR